VIPSNEKKADDVRDLFGRLASRYDVMNRLMTGGQDVRWRKAVIRRAQLTSGAYLLDLGAGTGDLGREALRQVPDSLPVAADFTLEMMRVGQGRAALRWTAADALQLPFPDEAFESTVSGFLMRNVSDVQQALSEQFRVLKPGGRIVILDTTRPKKNLFWPFIWLHLHLAIPFLGWLIARDRAAYRYLTESTENFLRAEELGARLAMVGFQKIEFRRLMFGTIAIHWAEK
jgi:demethylmenaquinone methyltransferase/2-methoxy-6-polyprenyl-1,4-benzoquinol methylase